MLAAPFGRKRLLAIDPGLRTGCKTVVLNEQILLADTVIHLSKGKAAEVQAGENVRALCIKHDVSAIAIGNGTASRETELFIKALKLDIPTVMVDEAGASVYSASEIARKEFPDKDITVRGAVSIGCRLQEIRWRNS